MMQKLSPVLVLDAIEPALPFFRDRLGFQVLATVPLREGTTTLGFAMLQRDAVEIMLQTRDSMRADVPTLAGEENRATLCVDVADIAAIERAVHGCEIVVPRRRTSYGADEIGVRAPGGHVFLFAQMGA